MQETVKPGAPKLLSREEELDLILRWQNGKDRKAADTLLKAFSPLLNFEARRAAKAYPHVSYLDHMQNLSEAFIRNIGSFDPSFGTRLSTYVKPWLWEAVQTQSRLEGMHRPSRGPRSSLIRMTLTAELARHPEFRTPLNEIFKTVGEKTNTPVSEVEQLYIRSLAVSSYDAPVGSDAESTFLDFMEDENITDPTDDMDKKVIADLLEDALKSLPERKQAILRGRFGMHGKGDDDDKETFESLSNTFGVSRERIRQIELSGLDDLREYFENHGYSRSMMLELFVR